MSYYPLIPPSCDSSGHVTMIPSHDHSISSYVSCVLSDGRQMFMRKRDSDYFNSSNSEQINQSFGNLLETSFSTLLSEAENILFNEKAKTIGSQMTKDSEFEDSSNTTRHSDKYSSNSTDNMGLWVDRYSPKIFSELLSPERTNREVLKALKRWDPYVFRTCDSSEAIQRISPSNWKSSGTTGGFDHLREKLGNRMSSSPDNEGSMETSRLDDMKDDDNEDEQRRTPKRRPLAPNDPRPKEKVILLSGPPGTGKTTLAHILAQHCGYRPFEVNASDDRSAEKLRDILQSCMQSHTLNLRVEENSESSNKRDNIKYMAINTANGYAKPNCIILDEIDGIDSRATIDLLIQIIKEPLQIKARKDSEYSDDEIESDRDADGDDQNKISASKKSKSKQKRGKASSNQIFPLTRPLICICNDLYAPVLRDLRKHASIFVFEPPTEVRLVQRLKQICIQESGIVKQTASRTGEGSGIFSKHIYNQFSSSILTQLCHAAGNDIRSAINTLQFANTMVQGYQKQKQSSANLQPMNVIESMLSSGLKDINQDIFQLWNIIFSIRDMNVYMARKQSITAKNKHNEKIHETENIPNINDDSKASKQFNRVTEVLNAVYGYDDYDLVISGCYHNYLRVPVADPLFSKASIISDWFSAIDLFSGYSKFSGEGFHLRQYVPLMAAALSCHFALDTRTKIEYPHKDREVFYQLQHSRNILTDLKERAYLTTCGESSIQVLSADIIGPLLLILSPKVRSMPFVALSQIEQKRIQDTVTIMADNGLTLTQSIHSKKFQKNYGNHSKNLENKNEDDESQTGLQYDPPIHHLVQPFQGPQSDHESVHRKNASQMTKESMVYELKKVLVQKAIDQQASKDHVSSNFNSRSHASPYSKAVQAINGDNIHKSSASNRLQGESDLALKPEIMVDTVTIEESVIAPKKGKMDIFFSKKSTSSLKRPAMDISSKTPSTTSNRDGNSDKKQRILFKFNQGFSNAVRRSATIKDFLKNNGYSMDLLAMIPLSNLQLQFHGTPAVFHRKAYLHTSAVSLITKPSPNQSRSSGKKGTTAFEIFDSKTEDQ